ncbi:siderophore-interacting protein [Microbacterium sp. YY-01]|uniref:siderophore-interacting protein n=1 Tax=Microbacterium sp. YY-01 TaxID=3421634 RepID=UPI003D18613A
MPNAKSSFTLDRVPLDLTFRIVTLAARELLAPDYVRIRLQGADLAGFSSLGADDHMRLFFPASGTTEADMRALDTEELRAFPSREYTPLAWGDDWLDVEFALHSGAGVASTWAASAAIGSAIGVGGPRGSAVVSGTPDAWLLVGDETAIPAIRRFAAMIPDATPARIAIEVASAADHVDIDAPVAVEWLHRGENPAGSAVCSFLDSLAETDRLSNDPFCFIAAEQQVVKPGRALLARWGVDTAKATVKGYWKRGEDEYHAPH